MIAPLAKVISSLRPEMVEDFYPSKVLRRFDLVQYLYLLFSSEILLVNPTVLRHRSNIYREIQNIWDKESVGIT